MASEAARAVTPSDADAKPVRVVIAAAKAARNGRNTGRTAAYSSRSENGVKSVSVSK